MSRQQRRIRALEAKEVETRGKLGALTDEVEKKRSQSADIDLKIGEKTGELDGLRDEIEQKILDLAAAKAECEAVSQRWSPFGSEKEVAGDVAGFGPSLPRLGAGKLRTGLESAQSSIASLMDAVRSERESKAALSALESESRRLERESEP